MVRNWIGLLCFGLLFATEPTLAKGDPAPTIGFSPPLNSPLLFAWTSVKERRGVKQSLTAREQGQFQKLPDGSYRLRWSSGDIDVTFPGPLAPVLKRVYATLGQVTLQIRVGADGTPEKIENLAEVRQATRVALQTLFADPALRGLAPPAAAATLDQIFASLLRTLDSQTDDQTSEELLEQPRLLLMGANSILGVGDSLPVSEEVLAPIGDTTIRISGIISRQSDNGGGRAVLVADMRSDPQDLAKIATSFIAGMASGLKPEEQATIRQAADTIRSVENETHVIAEIDLSTGIADSIVQIKRVAVADETRADETRLIRVKP